MDDRKEFRRQEQQARWENLITLLRPKYPDIDRVKVRADWDRFRAIHPEIPLDGNAFYEAPLSKETEKQQHTSSQETRPRGHGSSPFDPAYVLLSMFLHPKPEIMEQDKKYQKIEKELKEEGK